MRLDDVGRDLLGSAKGCLIDGWFIDCCEHSVVRPRSSSGGPIWPVDLSARTLPISKVKDKLNELVDAAESTREQVTITKNGSPAAVLIGVDEWESIQESLFWLSQPGIRESVAEAEADVEEGRVYSEEQIRAEFNVPKVEG